jgi:hypothetical protein
MMSMSSALAILFLVIVASPIAVIVNGPAIAGLLAAAAAISVAIVGMRIRPGEAGFLATMIRPMAVVASIPAIWMLIQAVPLQNSGLAHPIWKSTAVALGLPLAGSISIDPGATLLSFVRYLSATAIIFVAASVAVDRRRAEWILIAVTVATTLIALMALGAAFGVFILSSSGDGGIARTVAADCAGLGVILAAASALQNNTRWSDQSDALMRPKLMASLAMLAVCLLSVIIGGSASTYFAVVCGVATVVVAIMILRFGIGPWGIAAIASLAVFVAIAAIALQPSIRTVGLTLAFAGQAPTSLVAVTQRVLADTSWTGTGAGTFGAIVPIYRNVDELTAGNVPPTAAAAIAVEMGRPFFWISLIGAIALAVTLLRGALGRQRDFFYATAGASCVVTITLLSFGDAASLTVPVTVIGAVVIGLAIAQSKSRYA